MATAVKVMLVAEAKAGVTFNYALEHAISAGFEYVFHGGKLYYTGVNRGPERLYRGKEVS